jgi:uncharacterized protein involved in type VI secretion and phage assembly
MGVPYRPPRRQPEPRILGPQTATVVGPAGEEVYTDEHGRIKVQFHWDREGARDENSSCFVRVAQTWAHAGYGSVFIPRMGMEVVVHFLDGRPDRPLVTGCVYNGENLTPHPLPDEKSKSVIYTNTSIGGGGFNELTFEDAKGSEQIYIHGQKDWVTDVLNDKNTNVGNNQDLAVDANRTKHVAGDHTSTIDGNDTSTISGNKTLTLSGNDDSTMSSNRTLTLSGNDDATISGNRTTAISGNETLSVSGNRTVAISGNLTKTVGASQHTTSGGGHTETRTITGDMVYVATAVVEGVINGSGSQGWGPIQVEHKGFYTKTTAAVKVFEKLAVHSDSIIGVAIKKVLAKNVVWATVKIDMTGAKCLGKCGSGTWDFTPGKLTGKGGGSSAALTGSGITIKSSSIVFRKAPFTFKGKTKVKGHTDIGGKCLKTKNLVAC